MVSAWLQTFLSPLRGPLRTALAASVAALAVAVSSPADAAKGHGIFWSQAFGGGTREHFEDAAASPDGGALLVGASSAARPATGDPDAWLVKIGRDGELRWQAFLGGSERDVARAAAALPDGGFLAGGFTASADGDFPRHRGGRLPVPWAARLGSGGETLWAGTLPLDPDGWGTVHALGPHPDGGFVAVGTGYSFDVGEGCSGRGILVWRFPTGGKPELSCPGVRLEPDADYGGAVLPDGGAALAYSRDGAPRVARLFPSGALAWDRYAGPGPALAVGPGPRWGVAVAGSSPEGIPRIAAVGSDGSYLWETMVPWVVKGGFGSVSQAPSGGFFAAGTAEADMGEMSDLLALLLDADGQLVWSATAGGSGRDSAAAALSLADGSFIAAGATESWDRDLAPPARDRPDPPRESPDGWAVKFRP
ncbi:MAG: hypothetical protein LBQ79_13375 [Deltaproteobacteria bacterium]|jgi:hypothetical protein|nr:hypothetical protein [Deltaproteobacteria bacterium]